jgi:6-phosphogluconolactonase (cycloisomerase 2 family)
VSIEERIIKVVEEPLGLWAVQRNKRELRAIALEVNKLEDRIKRLEEAGDELTESSHSADDDIREHLQVANYNLHGLLNTGERITPPNPPKTVHQAGIDASVRVREKLRAARLAWKAAKEAKL